VNVLGKLTKMEVSNIEIFDADMRGPSGAVEVSLASQDSLAAKQKALREQKALRALKG
jgi:hypothetical protein